MTPWMMFIEMIIKLLMSFLNKDEAAAYKAEFVKAARDLDEPPEKSSDAARELIQRALEKTRAIRFGRKAFLRWARDEIPAALKKAKPALTATQKKEGLRAAELAAEDDA